VQPDFSEVDVGIARTLPPCDGEPAVREVEALFLDSIDAAERTIYIENQYATAPAIAARLARRLRLRPELEVLIVMPGKQHSWIEARAMRNGLIRFKRALDGAGGRRVRMVHPTVAGGIPTMVHSKVMIVDDRLLRVGSANLNNRSMGADSECDLAVEAKSADQRRAVLAVRHRLIADHCGVDPAAVARGLARGHSLLHLIDELRGNGHCLRAVDFGVPDDGGLAAAIEQVADPKRPLRLATLWRAFARHLPGMPRNSAFAVAIAPLIVLALALAWNVTPLSALAEPGAAREALGRVAGSSLAALAVLAAFVVGGLVAFPVLILIAATAATFGPWLGFAYSLMGVLASALLTYAIGARYGQQALRRLLGERLDRIRARIVRQGVLAVAAIRVVPLAPFTVVNLVAGASAVRLVDYVAGTLLGMLPGLIAMAVLGNRLADVMRNPSMVEFALLAMIAIVWIGLSFAVQLLVSRAGSRAP
jgi:uncharacterized membrane protein YdjX (TVP38/TMEM64 family)